MRVLNAHLHWMMSFDLRQPLAREVEIALAAAVWAGLVFVVVHFGALTAV
ncbi:MAG TPA: hypothetical protein VMF58_13895 [Rhizomicrobium sp.]|nr:hypothetical protein [Rhizomicrobium sp.]